MKCTLTCFVSYYYYYYYYYYCWIDYYVLFI